MQIEIYHNAIIRMRGKHGLFIFIHLCAVGSSLSITTQVDTSLLLALFSGSVLLSIAMRFTDFEFHYPMETKLSLTLTCSLHETY